ncbi:MULTISPECIES: hypothetical protein [unclassified Bradyrhizobium]|uniref:hypothetical protein n=1 Tax=Bradyrhizobium TaxID=374 RepID=UPI0028ED890C|nr:MULTISPECIES: hypothetical protein [unclassified Bradyrhizobium]
MSDFNRSAEIEKQTVSTKCPPGAWLSLESRNPGGKRTLLDPKASKFAEELVHLQKSLVVACAALLGSPLLERDTMAGGTGPIGERPLTLGDAG